MNIGLYFGAFNPIHDGHLQVAIYAVNNSDLDKVWFVLTPQSPHKIDSTLIDFNHRYKMLEIVCKKHKNILPSDIEKNLPKPSYSISTLNYLKKENDINNYSLIIGDDNIKKLTTWKQYSEIIKNHKIYVYPRNNCKEKSKLTHENIYYLNAPIINVSASNIRKNILNKKTDNLKIDSKVLSYLINNNIKINI
ncbi:MAG: nicotinate (nicotinamide) nucleotide adenylyltransferase [Flavobacteriales bacterium]|nr:MAG: nicotinate (nicotinamide) nucleotide adenylyltransferase [Flavobacteriales bacterium]